MHLARFDFVLRDGREISAVRHVNPDGGTGGWVAVNAKICRGAVIEPGAIVCPEAVVEAGELVKDGEVRT